MAMNSFGLDWFTNPALFALKRNTGRTYGTFCHVVALAVRHESRR